MQPTGESGFLSPASCSLTRRVLRDDDLEALFTEFGYVVVPFLGSDEVTELVDGYDSLAKACNGASSPEDYNDTFAEFTIVHSKPRFRRAAYELISSVLLPAADRYLIDHKPLIANFVNKLPGKGVVPTHQNFSVVDETEQRSVSVWVALVDCSANNGAMLMLDRSQRTLRSRRGMWAYQSFGRIAQEEIDPLMTLVDVPAGHAVILDDALVHYSPRNRTDQRRLAIQFVMLPNEVQPLWFQSVGGDSESIEALVWEVDERFFFDFWHGNGDTRYASRLDRIRLPLVELDLPTLHSVLAGGSLDSPAR